MICLQKVSSDNVQWFAFPGWYFLLIGFQMDGVTFHLQYSLYKHIIDHEKFKQD